MKPFPNSVVRSSMLTHTWTSRYFGRAYCSLLGKIGVQSNFKYASYSTCKPPTVDSSIDLDLKRMWRTAENTYATR